MELAELLSSAKGGLHEGDQLVISQLSLKVLGIRHWKSYNGGYLLNRWGRGGGAGGSQGDD